MKFFRLAILFLSVLAANSPSALAKRAEPKPVPALISGNIKYIAPDVLPNHRSIYGKSTCSEKSMCVEARNKKTGKLLWQVEVYPIEIDPTVELDVQYVYITSLKIERGQLIIKNESGQVYVVDLKTHKVAKRW
jgi:outer membrane protein assembly factor BamB